MYHRGSADFRSTPRRRLHGCAASRPLAVLSIGLCAFFALASPTHVRAQCSSEESPLQNYTGGGQVVCPCFVTGEEAAVILDAPVYPIEILRVGIAWSSQFGGTPQTVEQAIHIYGAPPPRPGSPIFTQLGPQLTDGFINEFDFEPLPGEIMIDSGPFMVSLEFYNSNAGDIFAPSVVHDGNGCQPGKNAVNAIPGGWIDGCDAGVTGDWVMYVIYRDCSATGVGDEQIVTNATAALFGPYPNPFGSTTQIEFLLAQEERVELAIYDVRGRQVATLEDGVLPPGRHGRIWSGRSELGANLPSGIYFVSLQAGDVHEIRKISYIR